MQLLPKSLSIIIADDCPFFRLGVVSFLKSQIPDIRITEASNGIEVIRELELFQFDIVIMDSRMGPLSCIESTNFIKEKYSNIKVIGLSKYIDEFYIMEMNRSGADGLIFKGGEKKEMFDAIKAVLNGNKFFHDSYLKTFLQINNGKMSHSISKKRHIQIRLREIIYLICMDKNSREIASILSLSFRTIEHYRLELNKITGSHSVTGIVKYGFQIDILNDHNLIKKFEKHFNEIQTA